MACRNLYWCSTPDHSQDWFVIAEGESGARAYFARESRIAIGAVRLHLVGRLPDAARAPTSPRYATERHLESCGARILTRHPWYIVDLNGLLFEEGGIINALRALCDPSRPAPLFGLRPN